MRKNIKIEAAIEVIVIKEQHAREHNEDGN
jgi:hypothetical protein